VVGVERLHAGDGSADVGLRSRLVGPGAEAQVRGDRDRKQDPENDDHDEKLDQRETAIVARQAVPQAGHSIAPSAWKTSVARTRSASDTFGLTPERVRSLSSCRT
jgi:hypothetical protein